MKTSLKGKQRKQLEKCFLRWKLVLCLPNAEET